MLRNEMCLIPMPSNLIVCSWSYQLDLAITNQIRLTQELGLMSLYCKYKYKPLAGLVVLLAKPKTGFCDHKRETHNESRLHNERRGKNDHCFARSIMTLVEMLHVP